MCRWMICTSMTKPCQSCLICLIQAATKILARQLVRLRQQITNLQGSRAQIRGVATHTQVTILCFKFGWKILIYIYIYIMWAETFWVLIYILYVCRHYTQALLFPQAWKVQLKQWWQWTRYAFQEAVLIQICSITIYYYVVFHHIWLLVHLWQCMVWEILWVKQFIVIQPQGF